MEDQASASSRTEAAPQFVKPTTTKTKFFNPSTSKAKKNNQTSNFIQKLAFREMRGQFQTSMRPQGPRVKPFTRLPGRLAFCLKDVIPFSAIEAGHIFMGFSKCGQFLLSYTQTTAENDDDLVSDFYRMSYHYRLHWWLFVPYRRAKKVAEVMLFKNSGTDGNLHLSFCQWTKDISKVLVFGTLKPKQDDLEVEDNTMKSSVPCYMTVTAVPSLNNCPGCLKVASTYEEDELAAAWDSCARMSCLEHGVTIHTSFDLVPPYPNFEPKISMKRDSCVVINSGNLLHCLHFDLEQKMTVKATTTSAATSGKSATASSKEDNPQPSTSKGVENNWPFSHWFPRPDIFSPPHTAFSVTSDSDCESDHFVNPGLESRKRPYSFLSRERLEKVAEFVEQLSPNKFRPGSRIETKKRMADKAYEMTDENFDTEAIQEKLSTFRRKRLAEKKYEFKDDEDTITTTSISQLRQNQTTKQPSQQQQPQPSTSATALLNVSTTASNVLRPITCNDQDLANLAEEARICVPELLSPGGMVKKDPNLASPPRVQSSELQQPPRFHAKFTRRFVELDEEAISVMTEIEDDDLGATMTGYHLALPLECHGTAYQPMAMISNAKAEKINKRCLRVSQHSLDVELLCHDMAQKLCHMADKQYWFCNDYDVEIVDLDPTSGEVICVAVVLVMATVVTKKVNEGEKYEYQSLQRHLYQGGFKFCWNIDTGSYYVIDNYPLKEITKEPAAHGVWHPAKSLCANLQMQWGVFNSGTDVRCFTNDSVIRGTSLKTIVDSDHFVAIILDDLE